VLVRALPDRCRGGPTKNHPLCLGCSKEGAEARAATEDTVIFFWRRVIIPKSDCFKLELVHLVARPSHQQAETAERRGLGERWSLWREQQRRTWVSQSLQLPGPTKAPPGHSILPCLSRPHVVTRTLHFATVDSIAPTKGPPPHHTTHCVRSLLSGRVGVGRSWRQHH